MDSFPQSDLGFLGSQKGRLFRERGGVGPGLVSGRPAQRGPGDVAGIPSPELCACQKSAGLA